MSEGAITLTPINKDKYIQNFKNIKSYLTMVKKCSNDILCSLYLTEKSHKSLPDVMDAETGEEYLATITDLGHDNQQAQLVINDYGIFIRPLDGSEISLRKSGNIGMKFIEYLAKNDFFPGVLSFKLEFHRCVSPVV